MKKPLLSIVQEILSEMDSDAVNSIDDTVESQQVAAIVRSTYENLMAVRNWEHQRTLMQLDASTDPDRPNYLKVPENIKELVELNYDCRKNYEDRTLFSPLRYKYPDEFLRYVSQRNSTNDNIKTVIDFSGVSLLIYNDRPPTYWTSFDDNYIVTDAYNSAIEDTLQKVKTQCVAYVNTKWEHKDDFVPDMPDEAFPVLKEQAKSTAFYTIKQMVNEIAQTTAAYHNRRMSRKNWQTHNENRFPNYGRISQK